MSNYPMQRVLDQLESGKKPHKAYINPADEENLVNWPIAELFVGFNTMVIFSPLIEQGSVFIDWYGDDPLNLSIKIRPFASHGYYPSPIPIIETA